MWHATSSDKIHSTHFQKKKERKKIIGTVYAIRISPGTLVVHKSVGNVILLSPQQNQSIKCEPRNTFVLRNEHLESALEMLKVNVHIFLLLKNKKKDGTKKILITAETSTK